MSSSPTFYPDPADKAAIAPGTRETARRAAAFRLAETDAAARHHTGQVAARIDNTRAACRHRSTPSRHGYRTAYLAAYVEPCRGRLEIIADFGAPRLASPNPASEAADACPGCLVDYQETRWSR